MLPTARSVANTVHSFPPPNSVGAGPFLVDVVRGPILPPRGTKMRDWQLRVIDKHDFSSMWQGARSGIQKKVASLSWSVEGPPRKVRYFQDVLGQAHFGHGWEYLCKLGVRDYLTQSYGWIMEIAGPGDPTQPLIEAPTGLNHLDAGRCYVTGNPVYPILYYSLWDGRLHKMHASRVYMMVDDPDPDERYLGIGTCALERGIAINQRELRMGQYIDALLDDKPQPGIVALSNVTDPVWQAAINKYMTEQQNDERPVFGRSMVITGIDPNNPIKVEIIPFSQTPEKFDFIKYTDLDVSALALALGVDRQELWELAGRSLGSGSQSAVLSMKSRMKLYGDLLTNIERFMNWAFLPEDCEFKFVEHDAQQDVSQAGIDAQLATVAQTLAALPGISPLEIKRLLADRSDTFKTAFTNDRGEITLYSEDPQTDTQAAHSDVTLEGDTPAVPPPAPPGQPQLPSGQQVVQAQQKAFSATSANFRNSFADIVTRLAEGRLRRNQAENLLLGLLLSSGEKAFADGLAQGGVTDPLDEDEQAQVQDGVADAIDYLDPLLNDAQAGAIGDVAARAAMWTNKTLTDFYNQGRISADRNGYYEWKLGKTEQHCPDCQRLNGQIHRFKDWYSKGWIPQSDKLACHGYRCDCRLDKAQGPGYGRF
jgi:hypothetical protein